MADNKLIPANINEEEGIAWLTLNRPERKCAQHRPAKRARRHLALSCGQRQNTLYRYERAGDSYSSGRDLYDMRSNQTHRRRSRGGDGGVVEIVRIMRNLPQVTLAAVRVGASAGDWP